MTRSLEKVLKLTWKKMCVMKATSLYLCVMVTLIWLTLLWRIIHSGR